MPSKVDSAGRTPARQYRLEPATLALLDWLATRHGLSSQTAAIRYAAREAAVRAGCPSALLFPVEGSAGKKSG